MSVRTGPRDGFSSRDGLFSRPSQSEQTQVSINMGQNFDLDNEVEGLTSQVGRLKRMARQIGESVEENSVVTNSLEETMENAKAALRKGMKRLNRTFARSKSNHLLYMALFVAGIFFVVIFWARVARLLRIF
jgi:hypothetical protein